MGIDGSSQIFEPNCRVQIRDLRSDEGKPVVIIDGRWITCNMSIGSLNTGNYIVDESGNIMPELYHIFIIALRFISYGIIPVFVFDGPTPHIKRKTVDKRRITKEKASIMLERIESSRTTEDTSSSSSADEKHSASQLNNYIKYLKRSYRLNTKNIEIAKTLLYWMGVSCIDAPGEADPQCAAVAKYCSQCKTDKGTNKFKVLGVITDDFDVMLYGDVNVLKLTGLSSGFVIEYTVEKTLSRLKNKISIIMSKLNIIPYEFEMTHAMLTDICVLMGTDYCNGVKCNFDAEHMRDGDGGDTIQRKRNRLDHVLELYIKNNLSFDNVTRNLEKYTGSEYVERLRTTRKFYNTAEVYDPAYFDISFQKPSAEMIKSICRQFLDDASIEHSLRIINTAYSNYINPPRQVEDKFASFKSYRERYARKKHLIADISYTWLPEPSYTRPIIVFS